MRLLALGFLCLSLSPLAHPQETPRWPSEPDGLLFSFQTSLQHIHAVATHRKARAGYALEARGLAHTDYAGRLVLHQGSYVAPDAGDGLAKALKETNELTIELFLIPQTTRSRERAPIITFKANDGSTNFALTQQGNKLFLGLRGAASASPAWHLIPGLATNVPMHLVISVGKGQIQVYQEGVPTLGIDWPQDFSSWRAGELSFGGHLDEGANWPGLLEGIAIYDRVISAAQAEADASAYIEFVESRVPPPLLRVALKLTGKSHVPSTAELAPYTGALAVFAYEVENLLEGSYRPSTLYAAHWLILDGQRTPYADTPLGTRVNLTLQPFEAVRALETRYLSDTIVEDFDLPLFYDAAGHSLGLDVPVESPSAAHQTRDPQTVTAAPFIKKVTEEERSLRARAIQTSLDALESRLASLGGLQAWRDTLRPLQAEFSTLYSDMMREGTIAFAGEGGFLFYRSSLSYLLTESFVHELETGHATRLYQTITALSGDLKEMGIDLIFVPIPARIEFYPHKILDGAPGDAAIAPQRIELIQALLRADVEAIDLEPAMRDLERQGQPAYFKNDSHWRPAAIERTAGELARLLARYASVQEAAKQPKRYSVTAVDRDYPGHLVKNMPKSRQSEYAVNKIRLNSVEKVGGGPYVPDDDSPIILVGDSYTWLFTGQQANIGAHLSYRLNLPIAEKMSEGGGANAPHVIKRMGYNGLSRRRVVVWMMASRWLTDPRWRPARIR